MVVMIRHWYLGGQGQVIEKTKTMDITRRRKEVASEIRKKEVASETLQLADSESSPDEDTGTENHAFAGSSHRKAHHRATCPGTEAFIPYDLLKRPKMVSMDTRIKLSLAEQAAYTQTINEECGGDNSKIAA